MPGAWSEEFTRELLESLAVFPGMDDPAYRYLVLRHTRERLGSHAAIPVQESPYTRAHLVNVIDACKAHDDPPRAIRALVGTLAMFEPDTGALARLEACEDYLNGGSALGPALLRAAAELLRPIALDGAGISIHELVRQVKADGEAVPLWGFEDDLPEVVRRLDRARKSVPVDVPLVVRFLARLAGELKDTAPQLEVMVGEIVHKLGLQAHAAALAAPRRDDRQAAEGRRVLRILLTDESTPQRSGYTIEAAVYAATTGREERIEWCASDGSLTPGDGIEEAGSRFLAQARYLTDSIGVCESVVEFGLPWPLLGQPVERWRINGGKKWIGHQFPVVVRSVDRERSSFAPWKTRWAALSGQYAAQPVRDLIGWLHDGNTTVPQRAVAMRRVVQVSGEYGIITQWLARAENCTTACVGLTFAYRPDDPVCRGSIVDAVEEGIPVLLWRRDNGDANELETLLEDVSVRELPERVFSWRRSTAACQPDTDDVRYHVVLFWDDPSHVTPGARELRSPHQP